MELHAVEALLRCNSPRLFALEHYLDASVALISARRELARFVEESSPALGERRRRSHEMMSAYAAAERMLIAADVDLQRYHRQFDIGRMPIFVGRLECTSATDGRRSFRFRDEHPRAQKLIELRDGDWLRIWSPQRTRVVWSGTMRVAAGSVALNEGLSAIQASSPSAIAPWVDRGYPAEYSPQNGM